MVLLLAFFTGGVLAFLTIGQAMFGNPFLTLILLLPASAYYAYAEPQEAILIAVLMAFPFLFLGHHVLIIALAVVFCAGGAGAGWWLARRYRPYKSHEP
jgi:hypothetical protein